MSQIHLALVCMLLFSYWFFLMRRVICVNRVLMEKLGSDWMYSFHGTNKPYTIAIVIVWKNILNFGATLEPYF